MQSWNGAGDTRTGELDAIPTQYHGGFTRNVTITPPPLAIRSIALMPSTVRGGTSLTATVHPNRSVLAGHPTATVSIRLSDGLATGTPHETLGCTGSPACTGPLTVPRRET